MENQAKISELEQIKLIYYEILDGCSFDSKSGLYIKHFAERESYLLLKKKFELFDFYNAQGVPHEADLLRNAIENGEWNQDKEDQILTIKYLISDNEKHIHNIIPQQRAGIEQILKDKTKELAERVWERKQILGKNIEDLIEEDVNDYVSFLSLFKDEECSVPITENYEEFETLENEEINRLNRILSRSFNKINEEMLKKISVMPFFLNKLSYCKDDIKVFLDKPIYNWTHHQSFLFSLGSRNLNVTSQAEGSPPDVNINPSINIHEAVKWYDIQYSILIGKHNSKSK